MGPEIIALESRLSEYVNVRHAIGCGSGTDALLMALLAENVRFGDAVLTITFTFITTAEVIGLLGATIGANATIVCGNTIGAFAFIATGAVVIENVPNFGLVAGNQACLRIWIYSTY